MTERNKNILLGVLIVGVLSMTVAFATLSTRLNIGGQASVASTNWNVHFDNWADVTENTITNEFGTQQNTAVHPAVSDLTMTDSTNITKVEGLNITLKQPNDYARYTFEIVNEGSIDAELSGFSANMTCTSNNNCSAVVDYEVKCYEDSSLTGTEVTTQSVLGKNGNRAYCYLQVKYKDQSSAKSVVNKVAAADKLAYTQEAISFSLAPEWTWVQSTVATNNNQGGGNVTPSNPYETTFNGNYTAYKMNDVDTSGYGDAGANHGSNGWVTSLDPNSRAYLRTTGSLPEACGVFGSGQAGTVCMTSSYYNSSYSSAGNYNSDFEDVSTSTSDITTAAGLQATGLKGYALSKAEEMLSKGASSCYVYSRNVGCDMPSGAGTCRIHYDGYVYCYSNGSDNVYVYYGGSTS